MHDLAPLHLAWTAVPDWENAAIPSRTLTGRVVLHIKTSPLRASQLGATLDFPEAGRVAEIGPVECLGIAPGEWLLIAPAEHKGQLAALARQAAEKDAAVAQADDRLTILELDATAELLARLTGLVEDSLRPGRIARTRLADIPITIMASPGADLRLIFDRIHAPHFRAWLERAI